jgi:hypothetical protein
MAKKGRIDDIVDIPKIEEQIKFVIGSLDKVIGQLEKVSEVSANINFAGFSKAKGVKDTTVAAEELNKQMEASAPLLKQLNALMKDKSQLEAKLVTLQTDEAKKTVELKLATQARNKQLQDQVKLDAAAVGSLQRMRIELEALKKKYSEATSDAARTQLLPGIQDLSKKVSEAEHAIGVFNRQVGNYELAGKSMRTEIRAMTAQLAEMKLQGLENTEVYQQLSIKAGKLADALGDAQAEVKKLASDTQGLDQLISVAEGLAGAYTVVEGASALMGVENEELQKTFVKLQAAMAVLNGLRSIQNVLQKESAAYTLAENVQKKLSVLLTYAQNKAESGGVITRKLATAAQWALNAAMAANPAGLLLVALVALVGIGYVLFKVFSSNAEIQKTYKQAIDNTKKSVENLNREMEKNVRAMEAMGASQQEITRARIAAAEEEYDKQSQLISMLLADYKHLSDEQKESLKELQKAQQENNDKISQLNDEQIANTIKQNQTVQKLKLETMKDGLGKELAILKSNADLEIKQAGDNATLVAAIKDKLAKDETDARKKYAEEYLKSEREVVTRLEESRISLMKDGFEKELALSKISYGEKIADLEDQLRTEENLSVNARKRIQATILNLKKDQLQEEEKLIVEWGVKANEKQIDLINMRLEATKQGTEEEYELKLRSLELQRQNEVANAEETGMNVAAINAKYDKLKSDESLNFLLGKLDKESRQRIMTIESGLQKELNDLRDQLENKKISLEEFERQREALDNKYNIKRAENQLKLAQQEIDKIKQAGGDTLAAEEKLQQAQIELDNAKTANFVANREKEKEAQQKLSDAVKEVGLETMSSIQSIQNAQFQARLTEIDAAAKKDEEAKEEELKRAGNNKAAQDQINAKYEAKQKERDAQRKKVEIEQAKFARTMALFQIAVNTAMAISKIWAEVPKADFGASTIALTAAAGIMGLLQAAAVAAQPLPQYFKGRESGPAEWAWTGEQGIEAIEHQGKVTFTPDKATLTYLPAGAKVIPNHKLDSLKENYSIQSSHQDSSYDFNRLEDGFQELSQTIRNKKEYHLQITENGLRKFVKTGDSYQEYLNRNVRL